nr:EcsC family protein [Burkholderia pseudomallei]
MASTGKLMANENDKPVLLKAIELVLADPQKIHAEAQALLKEYRKKNSRKDERAIRRLAVEKIISNYSYFAAFSGGATALTGVIPGLGTAISSFGGATADAALCMKFQIEMVMAIASVHGHDILLEEEKRLCLVVAGLGTISEAAKEGGKAITSKAFVNLTREYLKGATLQAVKEIFKKLGLTFARKSVEKAIPFGVGVVIGFSANKGLTWYVGTKARDFFEIESEDESASEPA